MRQLRRPTPAGQSGARDQVTTLLQPLKGPSLTRGARQERQAGRGDEQLTICRLEPEEAIVQMDHAVRQSQVVHRYGRQYFQVVSKIVPEVTDSACRRDTVSRCRAPILSKDCLKVLKRVTSNSAG